LNVSFQSCVIVSTTNILCCNLQMFLQLFSASGGKLTLARLGFNQIKPIICVPTYSSSGLLLSELCLRRQLSAVLSVNSPLHCRSGRHIPYRRYANDTRQQRSSRSAASYVTAVFIFMIGAAYAGVPLYRMICQVSNGIWLGIFYALHILCILYILVCSVSFLVFCLWFYVCFHFNALIPPDGQQKGIWPARCPASWTPAFTFWQPGLTLEKCRFNKSINSTRRCSWECISPPSELSTVPGNVLVKFEVRSFNRFGAIIDRSTAHRHTPSQSDTHQTKSVSPPFILQR